MATRKGLTFSEPRADCGAVLVTRVQLALLQGLLERPRARAQSYADWARAAVPYCRMVSATRWPVHRALDVIQTIHPSWVRRRRRGSGYVCQLTDRGRAILNREFPVWVVRYGYYEGMRALARERKAE